MGKRKRTGSKTSVEEKDLWISSSQEPEPRGSDFTKTAAEEDDEGLLTMSRGDEHLRSESLMDLILEETKWFQETMRILTAVADDSLPMNERKKLMRNFKLRETKVIKRRRDINEAIGRILDSPGSILKRPTTEDIRIIIDKLVRNEYDSVPEIPEIGEAVVHNEDNARTDNDQSNLTTGEDLFSLESHLKASGKDVKIFSSLEEVFDSLANGGVLEGIDLFAEIKKPDFRFLASDNPRLSYKASNALHVFAKAMRPQDPSKARVAYAEKADRFAESAFEIVSELRTNDRISSFRETVDILNSRGYPTPNGGVWRINTLQALYKRFMDLGLTLPAVPPKG